MFKLLKQKTAQMFLCAGPAIIGFILGLIIGAVVVYLMAKGVIPGGICPKIAVK
jgi:uncharacterized membrane-anchored protein YhcB (DUF1043 family)